MFTERIGANPILSRYSFTGALVMEKTDLIRQFNELKISRSWALYLIAIAVPLLVNGFYSGDKLLASSLGLTLILLLYTSSQLVIANKKIAILFELITNDKK